MPCNFLLRDFAVKVAEGIRAAGGTPMECNTTAISDGITMGTEGVKASLVSRDTITDSIELVARDKTIPDATMTLFRLNVPGLVLYGGSILPGHHRGHDITIQDVFEAIGANAAGMEIIMNGVTKCPWKKSKKPPQMENSRAILPDGSFREVRRFSAAEGAITSRAV